MQKIKIEECKSKYDDIGQEGLDQLDYHDNYLYVIRKEDHYDIIYH